MYNLTKLVLLLTGIVLVVNISNAQTFTRITIGDIVNDGSYSEGAYWFDYNNDGYPDMFVANIINQNNLLYMNNGNGSFIKILTGPVVSDGGFSYGGCFGDFSNNGFPDLFVINGGSSNNQNNFFYMNSGNETFTKITTGSIVTDGGGSWGTACVDFNGDGNLDIFVANFSQNNFLYKGNGDGTFTRITSGIIVNDPGNSISCSWADYNNDGFPDLFVANANFTSGQNNFLYHNNGDETFTKITTGNIVTDGGNSVGGSWSDYDNDGDLDLFVTNYFGTNNFLYRNDGNGNFTKITAGEIVNDGGSSVGSSWSDYDNDGDLDLFVSNDLNENNFLYSNNGNGTFTKVTTGDIVNNGGRSNGCSWADYDKDGDIDLFVTNGDQPSAQNNFLYDNNGNPNNWISILCKGTSSNRSAIGAKVIVKAMINVTQVTQIREVSGQTGYNAQNSLNAVFGLGDAASIDTIIIIWPNGGIEIYPGTIGVNRFITATEGQGISNIISNLGMTVEGYTLEQNYPNPFNPATNIEFEIPRNEFVRLTVFDLLGKEVNILVNQNLVSGRYSVKWDAVDLPGGVYFCKLTAGEFSSIRKMILLK